jgi:hypothetical protein
MGDTSEAKKRQNEDAAEQLPPASGDADSEADDRDKAKNLSDNQIDKELGGRRSRIDVAASVQGFRTTTPEPGKRGFVTQELLARLRDGDDARAATAAAGAGDKELGAEMTTGEEQAGMSAGEAAESSAKDNQQAVVVGNWDYQEGKDKTMGDTALPTRDFEGAEADASAIAGALGGYQIVRQDNQTAAQIKALLDSGLGKLQPGGDLLFYFSGHGTMEGLVGVDGSIYAPDDALGLRGKARGAGVNLQLVTDACHSGIFADALRGAEIGELQQTAFDRMAGSGTDADKTQAGKLAMLLLHANLLQQSKDSMMQRMRTVIEEGYELEAEVSKLAPTYLDDDEEQAKLEQTPEWQAQQKAYWEAVDRMTEHGAKCAPIYDEFVLVANVFIAILAALAQSFAIELATTELQPVPNGSFDVDDQNHIMSDLDDVDEMTNAVVEYADNQLRGG